MPLRDFGKYIEENPVGVASVGQGLQTLLAIGQEMSRRKRIQEAIRQAQGQAGTETKMTYDERGYPVPTITRENPSAFDQNLADVYAKQEGFGGGGSAVGVTPPTGATAPAARPSAAPPRPRIIRTADGKYRFETPAEMQKERRGDFADTTRIREEFLNRDEVKEYVKTKTSVDSMDRLLKNAKGKGGLGNRVALDQALITMFNKLTDPASVVRESEYARTSQNLPLVNRFFGAIQKVGKGGAGLTDSDREALVWGAKVIMNERGQTFNRTLQEYTDLSGQYGMQKCLNLSSR